MKQIITSLDVGSNSIKVLVGEIYRNKLFVLACSEVKSRGIKKGLVTDKDLLTESIKEAVKRTEDVIGIKIDKLVLIVPSYYADFIEGEGYTTLTNEEKIIKGVDITRALQASVYNRVKPNLELVSVTPTEFIIDEREIVSDPKEMKAHKLTVNTVLGTIPKKNIYVLMNILESLGIKVVDLSFGGYADYYEFRRNDYKNSLGAVINIGSDKTEVSIINKDILVSSETLEIGGKNIDRDISYIYDLSLEDSKKLKEHFALAHKNSASINEIIECLTKNNEHIKINQYEVSEIVYSRLREILDLSKKQINLLTKKELSYIIVTGGTTEVEDFDKVFKEIFGKNMQVTRVKDLGVRNNRYSSALGVIKLYYEKLKFRDKLASTIDEEAEENMFTSKKKIDKNNLLGKVFSYFFDN